MTYHYTYMMSLNANTPQELFYIGVRTSSVIPVEDEAYRGSSKLLNHLTLQGLDFSKEIVKEYSTRAEALAQEQFLIGNCIDNNACINLMLMGQPYNAELTELKLQHISQCYPDIMPSGSWPNTYKHINAEDLRYCVGEYQNIMSFIGHPDHLKYYYPTTGTLSYWPGRSDNLMTNKLGVKKFYVTDMSALDGSPHEQIQELFAHHFVSGQRVPVIQMAIELFALIPTDVNMYNLILVHIESNKEYAFLKYKLDNVKKSQRINSPKYIYAPAVSPEVIRNKIKSLRKFNVDSHT